MLLEQLKSCRYLVQQISNLKLRRKELRGLIERAKLSKNNQKNILRIKDMEKLEDAIVEQTIKLYRLIEHIETLIDALPQNKKEVLRLYYFGGLKWKEVAIATAYSREHCWRLQTQAIRDIQNSQHYVTPSSDTI